MRLFLIAAVILASGTTSYAATPEDFIKPIQGAEDSVTYEEILDEAIFNCPVAKRTNIDIDLLDSLIKIEKQYNLPTSLRGMLLAAACHESGYNPNAKGDRAFSKIGRAKAIGLFQMWPWWEKAYNIKRNDPLAAAKAYMEHVKKQLKKVKKQCKHKSLKKAWLSAWTTAIRAPKKTGRCNETPKFYRILKRWHRSIKKDREAMEKANPEPDEYPIGC